MLLKVNRWAKSSHGQITHPLKPDLKQKDNPVFWTNCSE
jgi:hypothetical protein